MIEIVENDALHKKGLLIQSFTPEIGVRLRSFFKR